MKFHQFKIKFVEHKKIFFGISIALLLIFSLPAARS